MALSSELVQKFVKVTRDSVDKKQSKIGNLYGTITEYSGTKYVKLDGSDLLTPIVSTVDVKNGERVVVKIEKHTATVLGNISSPAARTDDVQEIDSKVTNLGIVVADKVDVKELDAQKARIDTLVADNVTIRDRLTASEADISEITADNVTIKGELEANKASINKLETDKLDASTAEITYATIKNLEATNVQINNLEATYGDFVKLTTDKFTANDATIGELKAKDVSIEGRLDAHDANIEILTADNVTINDTLKAANASITNLSPNKADIDLANVNNAWIQNGIIKDGSIGEAAIHEGAITNAKIADATIEAAKIKTINADNITAGTLKTERLIITGPDGQDSIVKAINIANGVAEADVNGQKIQAASIEVVDLSAFQAKIAGFDMSGNAIYSGKESIKDPNSGIYISTTGIGMGDGSLTGKDESPLQAYADGSFKLTGKNSSFDFNTVTGELNIEASSLKISSKSVATKDDIDQVRDEITTLLRIESSRGTVFKNDQVATVLSVVLYHGKQRITDSTTMKEVFGSGAYLQWHWQRLDDESFGVLSSSDPRFGDEGFTFTLSPDDVDTKVTFMCELITE